MEFGKHTWAVVLAGGEGSRLHRLTTTPAGIVVPKQFCSLQGGPSLLQEALERAKRVTARERICTIVAAQHRAWWQGPLWTLPASNVFVQPRNRGTANGILFSLLQIVRRDPEAHVVLLPSDHHVRAESVLATCILEALEQLEIREYACVLLGIEPEEADPELGYIVPDVEDFGGVCTVKEFVEKPSAESARILISKGALWNGFILATRASALLAMFEKRFPEIVMEMVTAIEIDHRNSILTTAIAELYERLPDIDFSRHVAQGHERELRVLRVPECGWSDLGTPHRVIETLRRLRNVSAAPTESWRHVPLNLSAHSIAATNRLLV